MVRKGLSVLIVLMSLCLLLPSCSKEEHGAEGLVAQPYVFTDGRMGLSIFFLEDGSGDSSVQLRLTSPDGSLVWNLAAEKQVFDGTAYLGSSAAVMPEGSEGLSKGAWKLEVIYKDGTVLERVFDVSYGDAAKAIASYLESGGTEAVYNVDENLTVLGI